MSFSLPFFPNFRFGSLDDDVLRGSNGTDVLLGFAGDDLIRAGNGTDYVNGGAGDDSLFGGNGTDALVAGAGNDLADGGNGDDLLFGGEDANLLAGGRGNDIILAGTGNTLALGGQGRDKLIGDDGASALFGGQGSDLLLGADGADLLVGGQGNDLMDAGTGAGVHLGGAGADTFRIYDEIIENDTFDRIVALDFNPGVDVLTLGDAILGGLDDAVIDDITFSKALIQQQIEAAGLDEDVVPFLDLVGDGEAVERDLLAVLDDLPAELDAVRVTLASGDEIIAVGVTSAQLTDLLG